MPIADNLTLERALGVLSREAYSPLPPLPKADQLMPGSRMVVDFAVDGATTVATSLQSSFAAGLASLSFPTEIFHGAKELLDKTPVQFAKSFAPVIEHGADGLPETLGKLVSSPVVRDLATNIAPQIASQMTQMVPVAGWLIAIAVNMGRMVSDALQAKRADALPRFYPPTIFDPDRDTENFNKFVRRAMFSGRLHKEWPLPGGDPGPVVDWTAVFLPPGTTDKLGLLSPFGARYETDGSVAFAARTPLGLGLIPGSGKIHQAVDLRPDGKVFELGEFLPLCQDAAATLWQLQVQPTGPGLFAVDADVLEVRWRVYLEELRKYLLGGYPQDDAQRSLEMPSKKACEAQWGDRCDGRIAHPFTSADAKRVIDHYSHPSLFGWANAEGFYRRKYGGKWRTERVKDDDPWGVNKCVPVQAAQTLRARQLNALNTIIVAYLDPDYVALRRSAELEAKWQKRGGQLLEHPARCTVDLGRVIMPSYEKDLRDAGVGTPRCRDFGLTAKAPAAAVAGEASVPPPPDLTAIPQDHGSSSWWQVALGLGGFAIQPLFSLIWGSPKPARRPPESAPAPGPGPGPGPAPTGPLPGQLPGVPRGRLLRRSRTGVRKDPFCAPSSWSDSDRAQIRAYVDSLMHDYPPAPSAQELREILFSVTKQTLAHFCPNKPLPESRHNLPAYLAADSQLAWQWNTVQNYTESHFGPDMSK